MSFDTGWAAMNLDMPSRVPHYEPSAEWYHLELVKAVTGIEVRTDSADDVRRRAAREFVKAWNYDLMFSSLIHASVLQKKRTRMGHAEFAVDGADFDDNISCPFKTPEEALAFDPWETYGAIDHADTVRQFSDNYRSGCECAPDAVNTTGIYSTLLSGMIFIFGWDMLLLMAGLDPDGFGEVCNRYASWMQQYYDAMAECDAPVLYCHDDLVWTEGAFIHPDWYRKYIFPNIKKMWAPCVEAGKKVIFVCDGDYTQFADDIAACGNAGFWFEVFTDLETMVEKFGKTHVLIGNGDCRPLTFGTKADVRAEVERCMALGKKCPGYFMCMSGHFAPNIPLENALHYYDVYSELARR